MIDRVDLAANRILVTQDGAIVEDGTHDELVAAEGRYAQLFAECSGADH